MTAPATTAPAAAGRVTLAELEAIAAAARASLAERAALVDPREWTDPARARAFAAALQAGRVQVLGTAVHAAVPRYDYTASDALDAAVNAVLPAETRPACYLAESAGQWCAYFGTGAARAFGTWCRKAGTPEMLASVTPAELAAWLGETSEDPATLTALYAAYREEISQ